MKYLKLLEDGRFELREDSREELPENAIALTGDEYAGLVNETLVLVDRKIIGAQ
jgi:hypothetical protein